MRWGVTVMGPVFLVGGLDADGDLNRIVENQRQGMPAAGCFDIGLVQRHPVTGLAVDAVEYGFAKRNKFSFVHNRNLSAKWSPSCKRPAT